MKRFTIPLFLLLLRGFTASAMEKHDRTLVLFNDEQMHVPLSLLKSFRALKPLSEFSEEDNRLPLPSTGKAFRSMLSLLFAARKSSNSLEKLLQERKTSTLVQTIITADFFDYDSIKTPALQTLINKLKDDPTHSRLLQELSRFVCLSDLPQEAIITLKNHLFDRLVQNPKASVLARCFNHGEPIEALAANDQFVVSKSDKVVNITNILAEDCLSVKFLGDFVDIGLSQDNCLVIGYSNGRVEWCKVETAIIPTFEKTISHPGLIKLAINQNGTRIATGSYPNCRIKIWDSSSGVQLWEFGTKYHIRQLSFCSDSTLEYFTHFGFYGIKGPIEHYYKGTAHVESQTRTTKEISEPRQDKMDLRYAYPDAIHVVLNGSNLNLYHYKNSIEETFNKLSLEEGCLINLVCDHAQKRNSRYPLYQHQHLMEIYRKSEQVQQLIRKQVALNAFWCYWPF